MPDREDFTITPSQLAGFEYSQANIPVSEITRRLNALIDPVYVKELKNGVITDWLTQVGMLTNIIVNNKLRKQPSDSGRKMGIITEERVSRYGTKYEAIYYDLNAQHFITDNIGAMIELNKQRTKKRQKSTDGRQSGEEQ